MQIRVKEDSIEVEGYVNAVERNSKPLMSRIGKFIERICKGAFTKAIKRNDDVHILLNHDWDRDLGSTKEGNLELNEDAIGLHARATITDEDVVRKARAGELVGWSFGFTDREVKNSIERDMPLREVHDLDLYEVSLLDKTKTPAYDGTLVAARSEDGEPFIHYRGEDLIDDVIIEEGERSQEPEVDDPEASKTEDEPAPATEEPEVPKTETPQTASEKLDKIDYTKYQDMINEMKEEI